MRTLEALFFYFALTLLISGLAVGMYVLFTTPSPHIENQKAAEQDLVKYVKECDEGKQSSCYLMQQMCENPMNYFKGGISCQEVLRRQ